jgi:type IV pilus assembly protein PilA
MPVIAIIAMLVSIVILALNPKKQFGEINNRKRQTDVAIIADAIVTYANTADRSLLLAIPLSPASAVEACGDALAGSCNHLFNLSVLRARNLLSDIPLDPLSQDPDYPNEHTRYFLQRPDAAHVTVTAPDAEPEGATDIAATR